MWLTLLTRSTVAEIGRFKSPEATVLSEVNKRMDALNKRFDGIEEKMDLIIQLLQDKEWNDDNVDAMGSH